jgi:hypothetical protein
VPTFPVSSTPNKASFSVNSPGAITFKLANGSTVAPSFRITGNASNTPLEVPNIPASILPAPVATLWSPTPRLTGAHPRMLIPERSIASLRADYALTTSPWSIYKLALTESLADLAANPVLSVPPENTPRPNNYGIAEDPTRAIEDNIATLLLQFLLTGLTSDLTILKNNIRAVIAWGVPVKDLPLSVAIRNMSFVYDIAYSSFTAAELTSIANFIIAGVRQMRSLAFADGNSWRQTQFYANHNWFDYSCFTPAAIALWGAAEISTEELIEWINDAVIDMQIVADSMPTDGLNVEGPLYKAYGEQCFWYQAILEATVLNRNYLYTKGYATKLKDVINTFVPMGTNRYVPFAFADSKQFATDILGGSEWYRHAATRFNEPNNQLTAQILENGINLGGAAWRKELYPFESFLFGSTALAPSLLSSQAKDFDFPDTGVSLRRSATMGAYTETVLVTQCAPYNGFTGQSIWGATHSSGHLLPNKGEVNYWASGVPVLHPTEYGTQKLTRYSNLITFQGQGADAAKPHVGQIGEGGGFFSLGPFWRVPGQQPLPVSVIHPADTGTYATWLMELGSMYTLTTSGANITPVYQRRVVWLNSGTCNGVVVIVDRVRTAVPFQSKFRLLPCPMQELNRTAVLLGSQTAKMADSLISDANGFTWKTYANATANGSPSRMGRFNFYPVVGQTTVQSFVNDLNVNSFLSSARRNEAQWSATGVDLIYPVAIGEAPVVSGVGSVLATQAGNLSGVSVSASIAGVVVTAPTGTFNFTW